MLEHSTKSASWQALQEILMCIWACMKIPSLVNGSSDAHYLLCKDCFYLTSSIEKGLDLGYWSRKADKCVFKSNPSQFEQQYLTTLLKDLNPLYVSKALASSF